MGQKKYRDGYLNSVRSDRTTAPAAVMEFLNRTRKDGRSFSLAAMELAEAVAREFPDVEVKTAYQAIRRLELDQAIISRNGTAIETGKRGRGSHKLVYDWYINYESPKCPIHFRNIKALDEQQSTPPEKVETVEKTVEPIVVEAVAKPNKYAEQIALLERVLELSNGRQVEISFGDISIKVNQ